MRDTVRLGLGGLSVALLALTGCGGASSPEAAPAPTASATPSDGDGALVPTNLPDLPLPTRTPKPTPTADPRPAEVFGADISWPQCPKGMGIPEKRTLGAPMPTAAAEFVVI